MFAETSKSWRVSLIAVVSLVVSFLPWTPAVATDQDNASNSDASHQAVSSEEGKAASAEMKVGADAKPKQPSIYTQARRHAAADNNEISILVFQGKESGMSGAEFGTRLQKGLKKLHGIASKVFVVETDNKYNSVVFMVGVHATKLYTGNDFQTKQDALNVLDYVQAMEIQRLDEKAAEQAKGNGTHVPAKSEESSGHVQPTSGSIGHTQKIVPSNLQADENGVLWFHRGTDGKTVFSMSLDRSKKKGLIVLAFSSDQKNASAAAQKSVAVQKWLMDHKSIRVDVVGKVDDPKDPRDQDNGKGAVFVYYINGMSVFSDEHPDGNYGGSTVINPGIRDAYVTFQAEQQMDYEANKAPSEDSSQGKISN